MSFEAAILAFAERFLSERTLQLIVAPAIADWQFENAAGPWRRSANRLAVLRAVAGGLREDLARHCGSVVMLTLVPACYYIFLLVLFYDFLSIPLSTGFVVVAALVLMLSFGPVLVCFWPERSSARPVE